MRTPGEYVMVRATASSDPGLFLETGRRLAATLVAAAERHCDDPYPAVLDWGCGPGRVAMHIASTRPGWQLFGCDIDGEAVDWCNDTIKAGHYEQTGILPPLPCPDDQFGIVLACSVMTHLGPVVQQAWLPEIRRVLRPGGVFVASVHGRTAYEHPLVPVGWEDDGIVYDLVDPNLGDIAPPGYYRVVLQSESYTRREWGKHLPVAEYTEAGLEHHDLVVCRK